MVNKKGIPFKQSDRMQVLIDELIQVIEDCDLEDILEAKNLSIY